MLKYEIRLHIDSVGRLLVNINFTNLEIKKSQTVEEIVIITFNTNREIINIYPSNIEQHSEFYIKKL